MTYMEETITSAQNPKIKLLQELQQKSSMRRKHGLFVVEGRREVERCIQKGYRLDTVFVCPEISGSEWTGEGRVVRISPIIYNKVAYRGGTEGVIAEVATQEYRLHDLQLPNNPLVVVLESVEKPGVGFYPYSTASAPAGVVYLDAPIDARALSIVFEDEGETTAISEVRGLKADERDEFYNLKGQRVAQPTKGLYIVNGRKVVIK